MDGDSIPGFVAIARSKGKMSTWRAVIDLWRRGVPEESGLSSMEPRIDRSGSVSMMNIGILQTVI